MKTWEPVVRFHVWTLLRDRWLLWAGLLKAPFMGYVMYAGLVGNQNFTINPPRLRGETSQEHKKTLLLHAPGMAGL